MNKHYYVGIDLGGTTIKMGICTTDGHVMQEMERPTPKGPYLLVLDTFQQMLQDLLSQRQLKMENIAGVGVGVPAFLDVKSGFIYEIVNLGWKEVPLKRELETLFNLPCFVDNDANTAAIGEMWQGAGRGASHLICITVGTGIGGGLILNGDIYHGSIGLAGEVGHYTIRPDGRLCNCGNTGCLETETSATAILYYGKEAIKQGKPTVLKKRMDDKGNLTAQDVLDGAKADDSVCIEIVQHVGYYLGLTLAQISNVLNPEIIVIGGGVSKAGEFFLDPIRINFRKFALKKVSEIAKIVPAQLGNSAGWLGAAWLVHRDLAKNGGV